MAFDYLFIYFILFFSSFIFIFLLYHTVTPLYCNCCTAISLGINKATWIFWDLRCKHRVKNTFSFFFTPGEFTLDMTHILALIVTTKKKRKLVQSVNATQNNHNTELISPFFPLPVLPFVAEKADWNLWYHHVSACLNVYLSVTGKKGSNGNMSIYSGGGGLYGWVGWVSIVCPRWQLAQTPMKRSSERRDLHAGQCRNNGLIKAKLSMQGSLQVLGSWLADGMSGKGRCVFFFVFFSLLIKFRSRELTQSGVGSV